MLIGKDTQQALTQMTDDRLRENDDKMIVSSSLLLEIVCVMALQPLL